MVLGKPSSLIKEILLNRGVLITTYSGMLQHIDILLKYEWHYVVLDEGHKIRNPNSKVSNITFLILFNVLKLISYTLYLDC